MELFIHRADNKFIKQLVDFGNGLYEFKIPLGITDEDEQRMKDLGLMGRHVFNNQTHIKNFLQEHSAYKRRLRYGGGPLGPMPIPVVFSTPPTAVAENIEGQFREYAGILINNPNFTQAMGEKLGILAPETPFDPSKGKPKFEVEFDSVGHPILIWHKGDYHGVEIWKDSGSGYAKLDRDNMPDYIDKSALPALGESVTWKYKMVYIYKDEQAGKFSDEQVISVHGIL